MDLLLRCICGLLILSQSADQQHIYENGGSAAAAATPYGLDASIIADPFYGPYNMGNSYYSSPTPYQDPRLFPPAYHQTYTPNTGYQQGSNYNQGQGYAYNPQGYAYNPQGYNYNQEQRYKYNQPATYYSPANYNHQPPTNSNQYKTQYNPWYDYQAPAPPTPRPTPAPTTPPPTTAAPPSGGKEVEAEDMVPQRGWASVPTNTPSFPVIANPPPPFAYASGQDFGSGQVHAIPSTGLLEYVLKQPTTTRLSNYNQNYRGYSNNYRGFNNFNQQQQQQQMYNSFNNPLLWAMAMSAL